MPTGGVRVPIANSRENHSFIISLIYFEDSGPHCCWSEDGATLSYVLKFLGDRQRDVHATTPDKRDHYQPWDKLHDDVTEWVEARPAVNLLREYLWSFRVSGEHRLWGVLTDFVYYLIWNDPHHESYVLQEK